MTTGGGWGLGSAGSSYTDVDREAKEGLPAAEAGKVGGGRELMEPSLSSTVALPLGGFLLHTAGRGLSQSSSSR